MAQWKLDCIRAARSQRCAGGQRFSRRNAIDSPPIERCGHRQLVPERDLDGVTALEAEFRPVQGPDRCCRPPRAERRGGRLGPQHHRGAPLGKAGRRPNWGEGRSPQTGHQLASIQREFRACHRTDADHFLLYLSSCDALPLCCQKGPFFCCGGGGSCYKPAARGIAAGYGCFSRGRGGTGRRAGFRFQ